MNKKVVSCEFKRERTDKYGKKFDFAVKFEGDETSYQYTSTDKDKVYFIVGESAEFTTEEKSGEREDGSKWTIHKAVPAKPVFGAGGKGGYVPKEKSKKEVLCEHLAYNNRYVVDMVVAGKFDVGDWAKNLDIMMAYTEKKIDQYFA